MSVSRLLHDSPRSAVRFANASVMAEESTAPSASSAPSAVLAGEAEATAPAANWAMPPSWNWTGPGIRAIVSWRIDQDRLDPLSGVYASSTSIRSPTTRQVFGLTIWAMESIGRRPPWAYGSRTKPSWPNRPLAQSQAPDPHSLICAQTLRVTLEFSLSHCMKPLVSSRSLFALLVSALTVGFASSSSRSSILPLVLSTWLFA